MKATLFGLFLVFISAQTAFTQPPGSIANTVNPTPDQQEVMNLSKQKWAWMADKNVDELNKLFDEKSMFIHMGGSWGKAQELTTIKEGTIWYKRAEVYAVQVNVIDNTAILLNDIDLVAAVGPNEVINPFMVTEVYVKVNGKWKMGSLTFSRLVRPVKLTPPAGNKPQQ